MESEEHNHPSPPSSHLTPPPLTHLSPPSPHAADTACVEAAAPLLNNLIDVAGNGGADLHTVKDLLAWLSAHETQCEVELSRHRERLARIPTVPPPVPPTPVGGKAACSSTTAPPPLPNTVLNTPPTLLIIPQHKPKLRREIDIAPLEASPRADAPRAGRSPTARSPSSAEAANPHSLAKTTLGRNSHSHHSLKQGDSPKVSPLARRALGHHSQSLRALKQSAVEQSLTRLAANSGSFKRMGLERAPGTPPEEEMPQRIVSQEECMLAVKNYDRREAQRKSPRSPSVAQSPACTTVHRVGTMLDAVDLPLEVDRSPEYLMRSAATAKQAASTQQPDLLNDASMSSAHTECIMPTLVPGSAGFAAQLKSALKSPTAASTLHPSTATSDPLMKTPQHDIVSPQEVQYLGMGFSPKRGAHLLPPPLRRGEEDAQAMRRAVSAPLSPRIELTLSPDDDSRERLVAVERQHSFDRDDQSQPGEAFDLDELSFSIDPKQALSPSTGTIQPPETRESDAAADADERRQRSNDGSRVRRTSSFGVFSESFKKMTSVEQNEVRGDDGLALDIKATVSNGTSLVEEQVKRRKSSDTFGAFSESFRQLIERTESYETEPAGDALERKATLLSGGGCERSPGNRASLWSLALRARLTMIPTSGSDPGLMNGDDKSGSQEKLLTTARKASGGGEKDEDASSSSDAPPGHASTDDRDIAHIEPTAEQKENEKTLGFFDWLNKRWSAVMFLYTLYMLTMIPARCGLDTPASAWFIGFELVADLLLVVDMYWKFRRPYEIKGRAITDRDAITKNYVRSGFAWDVAAFFPLDIIGLIIYACRGAETSPWRKEHMIISPWWRVNKLLLARYADKQFTTSFSTMLERNPLFARALRTVWAFVLTAHMVTCLHLMVIFHEGQVSGIEFTNTQELFGDDIALQYLLAFDYCVKAMVGMGRPGKIIPITDLQAGFACLAAFVGVCSYAMVLSTISNLVSQDVSNTERWRRRMDEIYDVLAYIQRNASIPPEFTRECIAYFHHEFWVSRVLLGRAHEVLGNLPPQISNGVNRIVVGDTLSRVPMFRPVANDTAFLSFMLTKFEPTTFCKGERIMTKGEEGDCMYFIMHGDLGIFDEASGRIVFVCKPGTSLGEIALLHDCRRTATVVALDYCSCFVLKKEAFLEAEDLFPDVCAMVRAEGEEKLQKIKLTEIMGRVPLFAPYKNDPNFLSTVVARLSPKVYPEGTVIIEKGDCCEEMFFVSQGELQIGKDPSLVIGVGEYFGEVGILFDARSTVTLTATTSVTLFSLPAEDLEVMCGKFPDLGHEVCTTGLGRYVHYVMSDLMRKVTARVTTLNPDFFKAIALSLVPASIMDDDIVHMCGDTVGGAYFLARGEMAEIDPTDDTVSRYLAEGDYFGSISFLRDYTSHSTMMALSQCVVFFLSCQDFHELSTTYPDECSLFIDVAKDEMRTVVCRRLYQMTDRGMLARSFFKLLGFARLSRFERLQRMQTRDQIATMFEADRARRSSVAQPASEYLQTPRRTLASSAMEEMLMPRQSPPQSRRPSRCDSPRNPSLRGPASRKASRTLRFSVTVDDDDGKTGNGL